MTKKEKKFGDALDQFTDYLRSESTEKARSPLLYPLFKKLFDDKFKIENDAHGADVYVVGQILVESKTDYSQWLEGFYQGLHYHKKYGLAYSTIMVIANRFVGIWKVNKLPQEAFLFAHSADAQKAPNVIGKENARRTAPALKIAIRDSAFYWLEPKDLMGHIFNGPKNLVTESFEILKILRNLDSDRIQINTHNFIDAIERLKPFFDQPIDAVHCFYSIAPYWDITSTCAVTDEHSDEVRIIGFKGQKFSDTVKLANRKVNEFRKLIETHYIFTNEGSGLTIDYYFSRFDEVLAKIDPEYVKQHGIFFTNDNLSKFALWFVKEYFTKKLDEDFIVFDPAGGSGNLVSSWRGKLKHKIISELQPDLLKIIDRRMKVDPFHIETGFTIIPKTNENKGLNFLDRPAQQYLDQLSAELQLKNIRLDKPLAFLLNPPYKNTDENVKHREKSEAEYAIDPSIIELTGEDAGKERYLAFLGQILNMAKAQHETNPELNPVVMIFTPTSWLIPRPTYVGFREKWDKHFKYQKGFIVTSNEWFKLEGKWPLAFTIWTFRENGKNNKVEVLDLTTLDKTELNINWNQDEDEIRKPLKNIVTKHKNVTLQSNKGDIRELLPLITKSNGQVRQGRLNLYRNRMKSEEGQSIISGFPLKDDRHYRVKAPHGFVDGEYSGFMDDNTPVRIRQEGGNRLSSSPDRVWLQLRPTFIDVNLTKVQSGPQDKYAYCAYDLASAKATFTWFSITKAVNGCYPLWANQYDIWPPKIETSKEKYWYALCFAFVLAENRCVVTKFESNNPVESAPEVFVDNPLSTNNKDSFWSKVLDKEIIEDPPHAKKLVNKIKELYKIWNTVYTKGQFITHIGLQDEPYFKYFDYPDFLTKDSGLIQIRKFAELGGDAQLLEKFQEISELTKKVKEEIYRLLVEDFKYFE
jgi:hypothetical protein